MGLSNNLSCEAEVSPAAAPTPRGVFTQRFEALFPCAGALGCFAPLPLVLVYLCVNMGPRGLLPAALPTPFSATLSPALSVYLCVNVGPQVLLEVRLPAQFIPHSASLSHQSWSPHSNSSPLRPGCPSQPLLPVWMNVIFYLLGVGLPCSSIFCQFWLCEKAQCVYLHLHLGS